MRRTPATRAAQLRIIAPQNLVAALRFFTWRLSRRADVFQADLLTIAGYPVAAMLVGGAWTEAEVVHAVLAFFAITIALAVHPAETVHAAFPLQALGNSHARDDALAHRS